MTTIPTAPSAKGPTQRPCCLVVSADPKVIGPFEVVPSELDIQCEFTSELASAREVLSARRYDAVVADCDLEGALEVLQQLRASPTNRISVLMAVVSNAEAGFQAFKLGANFLLEKPISAEWTRRTLKAAHGTLWSQYRRFFRFRTNLPVTLGMPGDKQIHGTIRNISQGGLMLSSEQRIRTLKPLPLTIHLPGTDRSIEAHAAVVWSDSRGQAGMRFVRLAEQDWLLLEERLGLKAQQEEEEL